MPSTSSTVMPIRSSRQLMLLDKQSLKTQMFPQRLLPRRFIQKSSSRGEKTTLLKLSQPPLKVKSLIQTKLLSSATRQMLRIVQNFPRSRSQQRNSLNLPHKVHMSLIIQNQTIKQKRKKSLSHNKRKSKNIFHTRTLMRNKKSTRTNMGLRPSNMGKQL